MSFRSVFTRLAIKWGFASYDPRSPISTTDLRLLAVDPWELHIAFDLIPLTAGEQGGDLVTRITAMRLRVGEKLGQRIPPIRVRDNSELPNSSYRIKVCGSRAAQGHVNLERILAVDSSFRRDYDMGTGVNEPLSGLPAVWIEPSGRQRAERRRFAVMSPSEVIVAHLESVIGSHIAELVGG